MGQRHQYVVVYPKMYLGAGNCNNKPMRAEVIHHQWLYGRSAVFALDRVLRLAANCWDGEGTDYLFGREKGGYTSGDGTRAIAAAVSVDPESGYFHNVRLWADEGEKPADPRELKPDQFDNNDGVTLVAFRAGDRAPGYAFVTPSHVEGPHWKQERHGFGPWSAEEYLGFYYSKKERSEWPQELQDFTRAALARIDKHARLMTSEEVRALLPRFPHGNARLRSV